MDFYFFEYSSGAYVRVHDVRTYEYTMCVRTSTRCTYARVHDVRTRFGYLEKLDIGQSVFVSVNVSCRELSLETIWSQTIERSVIVISP